MKHNNPQVQSVLDLMAKHMSTDERIYTQEKFDILAEAFSNLYVRDEILGLAVIHELQPQDENSWFTKKELREFIREYAQVAPDGERAHPSIVACIAYYLHGGIPQSKRMYENCLEDDENNTLASLFMKMLQRGFKDETIVDTIKLALSMPRS
jgi:hypothetical protein